MSNSKCDLATLAIAFTAVCSPVLVQGRRRFLTSLLIRLTSHAHCLFFRVLYFTYSLCGSKKEPSYFLEWKSDREVIFRGASPLSNAGSWHRQWRWQSQCDSGMNVSIYLFINVNFLLLWYCWISEYHMGTLVTLNDQCIRVRMA